MTLRSFEPVSRHRGIAARIEGDNIDTDQIVPHRFLAAPTKNALQGAFLHDWRFDAQGAKRPEFVLNRPPYDQASILIVDRNFGCGSSREHAAWAIVAAGIRALLGLSFADAFRANCANNGIACGVLRQEDHERILSVVGTAPHGALSIDIENGRCGADGALFVPFQMNPFQRLALLNGQSTTDIALEQASSLPEFEQRRRQQAPWLYPQVTAKE